MLNTLCSAMILMFALAFASDSKAQHMIGGVPVSCVNFQGFPVMLVPNAQLNDIGRAVMAPNGQPVMLLNPIGMNNLPPSLQLFIYAHECAHHALGHLANPSLASESQADCWAIQTGRNQGWFPPHAFQALIAYLGNSPGSPWGHFPGPQRIQNIMMCYQS
ncbi:MAG TPA: hypothetical protein VGN82_14075 [Bosea sp. (in: a-proteobacteria)]|jgi:hypothetical protein|uniref:hypothetical protein n=1 Tax=Bosea sp. (in: a-proteobacteria) TaxID=1871050 RepID=UPI002E138021|nr:hypothetical protein [Bosea sp. (in: a-proteobacteria)]